MSEFVPKQWILAWDQFGREHPRLKHGPAVVAFLLFTFLGQSILGLIRYFYGVLPLFSWPLMFLSTTALAQMFVIRFAGKAYERQLLEQARSLEKLAEHKLIFEINGEQTSIRLEELGSEEAGLAISIVATIQVRFENLDPVQPISMKRLDIALYRGSSEIFTWKSLRYSSNGAGIKTDEFEGMMIQGGRLTSWYILHGMLTVADKEVLRASDITYADYITLTMYAGGHQKPLTGNFHPHWSEALTPKGTNQITVTGVTYLPKDFRRLH
ncbi:MAG TPA: hypothetical protein VN696_00515 [Pyrinomonadaceae bacterium]|nr:hypothetical protein [Pyrinomonadaceae bacterium]